MMKLKDCEILLTEPRGFCAGVERAIGIVNRAIEMFDEEIYVKHEVVHNKNVIEELTKKGVVFIESLTEVPDKSILIYSAHGVSKEVTDIAQKKNLTIFDATCPLVTKVHFEIHKYARENIDVILIGHNGHPEVEGTMGQYKSNEGKIYLVESKADVETLEIKNKKISYVTQTTLSVDDTQDIVDALKEKYPHIGHAVNKILKDFIIKSKIMSGFHVPFIPGWDCHGLPIELQVEKKYGKSKFRDSEWS